MEKEIEDFIREHKQQDEYYEGEKFPWYMSDDNVIALIELVKNLNNPVVGRSFTNVFVEIDGKLIPIREMPKIEYEEFLEGMHRLRLAYISVVGR